MSQRFALSLLVAFGCATDVVDDRTGTDPSGERETSSPSETDLPVSTGDTGENRADTGQIEPGLTWIYVDTGMNTMSCGLVSDGTVRCWGIGLCTESPGAGEVFDQVSVGGGDACGIRDDGTVACWCCDTYPRGEHDICREVPAGTFERVLVGQSIACAQDAAGVLTCWGWDGFVGEGSQPLGPVGDFAVEANIAAAVLPDGHVQWWGVGSNWDETPPPGVQFADISVGRNHACALDVAGTAHCWGLDFDYEPFPDPPLGSFAQIETFHQATCVIDTLGAATCWWGADNVEVLDRWVDQMPTGPFANLGLVEWSGCGVDLAGEAWCWGGEPSGSPWILVPNLE